MNIRIVTVVVCVSILTLCFGGPAMGGWDDVLDILQKGVEGEGESPSEGEIIQGLKEALKTGAAHAVALVSEMDGYYKNPEIKIPLPAEFRRIEEVVRGVGLGGKLDALEESMNRAAEKAAPEAETIFWDAIREMNFSDAGRILRGGDDEATRYFRETTREPLRKAFEPIVHQAMSQVGGVQLYQGLIDQIRTIPFLDEYTVDIDAHVTGKALDGLFVMLAKEEKKIREDPAARVTDLLKKVFGSQTSP